MYEAENGHGNRFQKVEQMFDEWAARGQSTFSVLGLLKTVSSLCELDQKRPYVVCMKLFEMNGLSWLIKEINRLMLDVLT